MIGTRKIKKPLPYFTNKDGMIECSICGSTFLQQSNACKHIKKFHSEPEQEKSIFKYKGKNINKLTEKVLIWKCSHGIPMAALNDNFFNDLLPPSTLMSPKTNQKILDEMCEQIVHLNYSMAKSKSVSLILDGGTVNHTKWLAIGFLHRTLEIVKFQVLDVKVFDRATSSDIRYEIDKISDIIKKGFNGKVVAVCTNNAANFCKVFLDEDINEDFIPIDIIRVSCACHTIQLALKDLKKEDHYLRELIKKMKAIPTKISFLSRKDIEKLRITSFPPLQKQRWNSVFITLSYIILNVGSISSLFTLNEIGSFNMFELIQLQNELRPVYEFTTRCESDNCNQADVYIEFRALESKLEIMKTKRSQKLLSLIRKRFSTTADISLSKLCYFTTNAGLNEKRERFPHISLSSIDPKDTKSKKIFDDEIQFIKSFEKTIIKICNKIKADSQAILSAFEIMMNHIIPINNEIHQFPRAGELKYVISDYTSNQTSYIDLAQFIEMLQVLPSSEAGAERVFARMRDIFHKKQTRLSPKSLRTNLIVSFYAEQERPDDYYKDIDNWFLNEEEDQNEEEEEED